ncbi:hypothetical protein [Methylosinus sp. PW1]|uniref:hypothetical protein n=1 Tax=Methylosinus sp. PW1 TaxID=107636 RepID=UPI00056118E1|nr:hypothetical protein [Methylosinus sp. PW1]
MAQHASILAKLAETQDSCRSLPFCDPPIPGESLVGLLARNVAKHGLDRIAPALKVAGIHTLVPEAISTTHIGKSQEIASLLRTASAEITMRCHPRVEIQGRPKGTFINFFGTPVRSIYREVKRRRVSPSSLCVSSHQRAIWDLRVFSFCPESREVLISECPSCGKGLGWRWTLGVAYCEHCGVDLREYRQPIIDTADADALDFVVDLVHPDRRHNNRALSAVPPALGCLDLDNGEIFELVIALGSAIATEPSAPRVITRPVRTVDDKLTPNVLAQAGRVILDWPCAFHALADDMRARSEQRVGFWGKHKELGPIMGLARDAYLAPALKHALHDLINENMAKSGVILRRAEQRPDGAIVNIGRAAAEFDLNVRLISRWAKSGLIWSERNSLARLSIILVDRNEIAAIVDQRQDLYSARQLRMRLGVDSIALDDLVQNGLIRRHSRPVADFAGGICYSRTSADAFIDTITSKASSVLEVKNATLLSKAVKRGAVARPHWYGILQAIIDGRLRVVAKPSPSNSALTASLYIVDSSELTPFLTATTTIHDGKERGRMYVHEAAAYLNSTKGAISGFIKSGLLSTNGSTQYKLDWTAVDAFRREYILTNEIAHRCGWKYIDVRTKLAAASIEPVTYVSRNKNLVWPRASVEAAIGHLPQHGEKR